MQDNPIIIGVSGKKQSGKTSLCEYLQYWLKLFFDEDYRMKLSQDEKGEITLHEAQTLLSLPKTAFREKANKISKIYNFADPLKKLVCHQVLGIPLKNLYGTDEDKNQLTEFIWENMPDNIAFAYSDKKEVLIREYPEAAFPIRDSQYITVPRKGRMTAREVMQIVGTDLFRKCFSDNVWVDATFRTIENDANKPELVAFIPDVRFPSEVDAIINHGGYIIRLSRSLYQDSHPSETSLDDYDFEALADRALIVDNTNLAINEKNEVVVKWMKQILK